MIARFYLITVEVEARGAAAVLPMMLAMDAIQRFNEELEHLDGLYIFHIYFIYLFIYLFTQNILLIATNSFLYVFMFICVCNVYVVVNYSGCHLP